jgi:hypothetical protein
MTVTAGNMAMGRLCTRVLAEGYGPGAWHGPDLKAALADVTAETAFRRPAEGRHNIAEIALHHAYFTRAVRGQISGEVPEPFLLDGEDWFALNRGGSLTWDRVEATVENEQRKLVDIVSDIEAGRKASPVSEEERFNLALGIACHAIYHAGQVQLIKRLIAA